MKNIEKIKDIIENVIRDNIHQVINSDNSYYYSLSDDDIKLIISEIIRKL